MTRRNACLLLAALTLGLTPLVSTHAQEPLPSVQDAPAAQLAPAELPGQDRARERAGSPLGPPSAAPPQPPAGPPFQLDPTEQQFVDQILQQWENQSSQVKTFDCKFERWEYDPVFGPADEPMIKSKGRLTYSKPDKGSFKIDQIYRYTQEDPSQPGEYELQEHEVGEHWVCDGKAIYEYKHEKKQLVVQPLPKNMRGKSIVDGPLPFLFGAEADKLKARYWIRTRQSDDATIWLEAYPRTQEDAANYHHVEVMLNRKTMMPTAIQVHMPNGRSRAVYMFQNPKVNDKLNQLFGALFASPRTPLGWTRVVQEVPPETPPGPQAANPQSPLQQR